MNKQQVLDNIEIARKHLLSLHLLLPDEKLLFDCYCLPSFRWKAFYSQIYMTNGVYRANCAYTHYADYLGVESYSVHFTSIAKDRHTAKTTDVICKTIFPAPDVIRALFKYANDVTSIDRFENESTVIDGITAGIRLYENGCMTRDICLINPHDDLPLLNELLLLSDTI
ncbi:MAG: hypothetical protein IKW87_07205 [Ruminococcus sp.]|nr:hypothetical protein [Ruminococcus sp.]